MQGRNRDADVEKRKLVDTAGEGESGTNWESRTDPHMLPCGKQTASGKLPYRTGSRAWCSVVTWRGGMRVRG